MKLNDVLDALFPGGCEIRDEDHFVRGTGETSRGTVAVIGTSGAAPIGTRLALALADAVLDVVEKTPGRPLVFLVDTSGQALARREEMLGLNGYLAHLARCVDLARRQGHPSLSLVYEQAVSGGYLSFGLMTDRAYALASGQIRVMDLKAMARVTKLPHERLIGLAAESPVFAPGAENYLRMGAIHALWPAPSAELLEQALDELADPGSREDRRASVGLERGGRLLAQPTLDALRSL